MTSVNLIFKCCFFNQNHLKRWNKFCLNLYKILIVPIFTSIFAFNTEAAEPDTFIWWEAENFSSASYLEFEQHDALSNETWINLHNTPSNTDRFIEYDNIKIDNSSTYHFYVRKFWKHGPFNWNFDDTSSGTVRNNPPLIDSETLRTNTGVNWVYAGTVDLKSGVHSLRINLLEKEGAASFDAFLLTSAPFPFRGKNKPDDIVSSDTPGWFPWTYQVDSYQDSAIDLSFLNEEQAGNHGFIQTEGEYFTLPHTNEVIRFWGVNAGFDVLNMDNFSTALFARDLAKYGVNLVRVHTPLFQGNGKEFEKVDEQQLDRLFYFIKVMKDEGIYVSLSLYFPLWLQIDPTDQRFPGYHDNNPFSLLFFDPEFQSIYQNWWKTILSTTNPYTSTPLKDETAILSLELINEDSLLFWTFNDQNIPPDSLAILQNQFSEWLISTYGSLNTVSNRWGGFQTGLDSKGTGSIGLIPIYEIGEGNSQRARDTARFLTETQMSFFKNQYDYIKEEIGYGGLISGSNWITANAETLGPLDKYSNAVGDFMDQHGYFEPQHSDNGNYSATYSIREGHNYKDRSALKFEALESTDDVSFSNPLLNIIYDNKPSMISEINWTMPNRFRADMPFLFASFGSLQGVDALIHFTAGVRPWELELSKFSTFSPVVKGQWPAAALAFRLGYIEEGEVVSQVSLPIEEHLYELKGSPLLLNPNLDNLRRANQPAQARGSIHPLRLLTGRSKINFTDNGDNETIREEYNFANLIDIESETINTSTDQLFWDYGKGFATVSAPKIQGITGFLSDAGSYDLGDIIIKSQMEYGSIWLISLDEQPLSISEKMLLVVMSEEQNSGWQTETIDELKTITNTGSFPILLKELSGSIKSLREDADKLNVTILDQNGYRESEYGNFENLELNARKIYYLIER